MILVTGAGGTVGSELTRQLKAAFRAAYHTPAKADEAKKRGIEAVVIDYSKPETLRAALQGVDKLFLLSAGGKIQVEHETAATNAAKDAGVKHIVKLSVWRAADEPFALARIHRAAEKAIEKSGLRWTFLRPCSFMQNMANYSGSTIRSDGAFYGASGTSKYGHVDVRDIAAVAVKALTGDGHEGKAYDLSSEALSNPEIAQKLSKATGRQIRYVDLPPEQLRQGLTSAGIPADYADLLLDLYRYYRDDPSAGRLSGDLKKLLGRDPISFDQYARDDAARFQ